ncbi:hypothetical protein WICPIJ_010109 [Wickerhamomyces pijperi]|uniref:mitogen-activated protein kinase kinase kinase n=1 Tax=Wickerhamomyces pijperi TaxID=599730 RepID=A0A9P8TB99_WICPI|nr:hypothetical protein WICPIJ_010109 [Wickerhamomyces pijperi]
MSPELGDTPTIETWLNSLSLSEYSPLFANHDITYDSVAYLDESILKDIGVLKIGDRIKLNNSVKKISKQQQQHADVHDSQLRQLDQLIQKFDVQIIKRELNFKDIQTTPTTPIQTQQQQPTSMEEESPSSKKSLVSFILESGEIVPVNVANCFNSHSIKKKLLRQLFPHTTPSSSSFDVYITDYKGNLQLLFDVELVTICHSPERVEKGRLLLSDKHSMPSKAAIAASVKLCENEPGFVKKLNKELEKQKNQAVDRASKKKNDDFRSVFGQRPSSQLISTNLARYFPDTTNAKLQRTVRNSVRYSIMSHKKLTVDTDWSDERRKSSVGEYLIHSEEETMDSLNLKASLDDNKEAFTLSSSINNDTLKSKKDNRQSMIELMSIPSDSDSEDEEFDGNGSATGDTQSVLFPKHNQFSNWLKGARIGSGSFGTVYLGMNAYTGELMAVKQVDLHPSHDQEGNSLTPDMIKIHQKVKEALTIEMKLLSELKHPHIVTYLGSSSTEQHLNIFLEYVPGGSLSSMLKTYGPLEEPLVRNFTRQILIGLNYLHSRDIIHRDIKGANILIDINGQVKISDFGISKKLETSKSSTSQAAKRASLQGSVYWMAPEVVKQQTITKKSDIWSLGCLIIEMFTGTHAYPEFSQMQAIFKIGTNVKPEIPSWCSEDAMKFLELCLEVDVKKRGDAGELLKDGWLREASLPVPTSSTTTPTTTQPIRDLYCDSCLLTTPSKPYSSTGGPTTLRTTTTTSSYNESSQRTYQTSQTHPQPQLNKKLSSLTRKILSEESLTFSTDPKADPIIFRDDVRGVSLVCAFKVWDLEARGSWRRYCFIINETEDEGEEEDGDQGLILRNFDMIRDSLSVVIAEILSKNERLKVGNLKNDTNDIAENNDSYLRGKVLRANGLTASTKDDQIYVKVHIWGVRLLSRIK